MIDQHPGIKRWVDEVSALTTPDQIVYCDGSQAEKNVSSRNRSPPASSLS